MKDRQPKRIQPIAIPVETTTPFAQQDLNLHELVRDPVRRCDALKDASVIFAAQELANGVPFQDVERMARKVRDTERGRLSIMGTLATAKTIFDSGQLKKP